MNCLFEINFYDTMKHKKYVLLTVFLFIIIVFLLFFRNNEDTLNPLVDIISVPVDVYIVKYDDESFSSTRDQKNINKVFRKVNDLWSQANIHIDVRKIEIITVNEISYYYDLNLLLSNMVKSGNYDSNRINAYFARTLQGPNGIAFPGNRIMVADRTSVYDYRATSHEIGHVLGLQHVRPVSRLMAMGVNGFDLNEEEINIARGNGLILFPG